MGLKRWTWASSSTPASTWPSIRTPPSIGRRGSCPRGTFPAGTLSDSLAAVRCLPLPLLAWHAPSQAPPLRAALTPRAFSPPGLRELSLCAQSTPPTVALPAHSSCMSGSPLPPPPGSPLGLLRMSEACQGPITGDGSLSHAPGCLSVCLAPGAETQGLRLQHPRPSVGRDPAEWWVGGERVSREHRGKARRVPGLQPAPRGPGEAAGVPPGHAPSHTAWAPGPGPGAPPWPTRPPDLTCPDPALTQPGKVGSAGSDRAGTRRPRFRGDAGPAWHTPTA